MENNQTVPLANQIWYTASDNEVINPAARYFSAIIVSNRYEQDRGIIEFNKQVTDIGWNAFMGCKTLVSIILPMGVTEICDGAFCGCAALEEVVVPDSVTKIGKQAFAGCTALKSISIPNSVEKIGEDAFDSATEVTSRQKAMPQSDEIWYTTADNSTTELVVEITDAEVVDNSYTNGRGVIKFNKALSQIANNAFYGNTAITSITLPEGITAIGNYAFSSCRSLISISLPQSLKSIGSCAFEGCSALNNIELEQGVESIGQYAFTGCLLLKSVTIPDNVTAIPEGLFFGCRDLNTLYIGSGVTEIESHAFERCQKLRQFYCKALTPQFSCAALKLAPGSKVFVPQSAVEAYRQSDDWSRAADRIVGYSM